MPLSYDNQLENQSAGQADWDSGLNANFAILERGFHLKLTAGTEISSGQMCIITSAGFAIPYDARSFSLRHPHVISYRSVTSGAEALFIREGVIRSMDVWSGFLVPGQPFFSAITSLGFAVSSYAGAGYAGGIAIGHDAVYFAPGKYDTLPSLSTTIASVGPVLVGSFVDFLMQPGNRGLVTRLNVITDSCDAYKVQFWSNSTRVTSELQYETLTRSQDVGSVDIRSLNFIDAAPWPHTSTNLNSLGNLYGRISVQSGSSVNTGHFSVEIIMERFR